MCEPGKPCHGTAEEFEEFERTAKVDVSLSLKTANTIRNCLENVSRSLKAGAYASGDGGDKEKVRAAAERLIAEIDAAAKEFRDEAVGNPLEKALGIMFKLRGGDKPVFAGSEAVI